MSDDVAPEVQSSSWTRAIQQRLARVYAAAIDLYTAPPHRPGCMIVGTAAVESPTYPKIAQAAAELLAGIEKSRVEPHNHHPVEELAFVPAPEPTHAPAVELVAYRGWFAQTQELRFELRLFVHT